MLKNMFRFTAYVYIWKRYSKVILSTLCLFGLFWLVGNVHSDYIEYSQLQQDNDYLALSFVIKWATYLVAVAVYLLVNAGGRANNKAASEGQRGQADLQLDPFDEIRTKDKLRSAAEMVIEKHKK